MREVHAIRLHAFGPPEGLHLEELPDPVPGPGQVRLAVGAAGVHLLDTSLRRGEPGPLPLPVLPHIPGREVAGRVDAVGPGVARAWIGRRAVAHLGPASGGYAELVVVAVDQLLRVPDALDEREAVTMVGTGRTVLLVLDALGPLGPEDVVLVPGAAGGMGALLVQASHAAGARVVALAGGPAKVRQARDLGADAAVDYRAAGWVAAARAVVRRRPGTVLLDGVGGEVGAALLGLLAPGARVVPFGWSSGTPTPLPSGDGGFDVRRVARPDDLRPFAARALDLAARGVLVASVDDRFGLADAAAAHRALEDRATSGKVVLVP